ncbi:MAG: NrtA/SsuA/CpmA family ABC transporter substrate-binding protein [Synergistaceae bacterium]|jgi:sulfonate transport system substrate-binding protein|nr:NrtA/SsuA/CpmA family ABC transporter substrate-binding protein [Synergistaceae bacterium]
MTRRIFAALVAASALICAQADAADLRISVWKLPFNVPVMMEMADGLYETSFPGFNVSAVNLQTGPKQMAALAAGDLDIVQGIGDAAFLVSAAGGIDARIIAVNSRSPRAFAVVARGPEIEGISGLKGKSVAGLRGSVVHQVFVSALAEAGMKESDVEFFPMPVAQAASTLLAGRADAALLVGSEIQRAVNAGCVVIADGLGRVDGLSLVVASSKFIDEHPEAVRDFLALRSGTLEKLKADPAGTVEIAARETGLERSEAESMMGWYDFGSEIRESDRKSLLSTLKYLLDNELVKDEIDVGPLIYEAGG